MIASCLFLFQGLSLTFIAISFTLYFCSLFNMISSLFTLFPSLVLSNSPSMSTIKRRKKVKSSPPPLTLCFTTEQAAQQHYMLLLASVNLQRSWICASGGGISWWNSASCDCTGPRGSGSLCCSGCTCRLSLVRYASLSGCSSAAPLFHLQLAVIWCQPSSRGRCQAPASQGSGCW